MKYLQLKIAEFIGRVFPRQMGYGVARRLADLFFLVDRRGRDAVISNLQRIHARGGVGLSSRALRALARENFLNFAKYLVDFFHFLHLEPERMHRLIDFGNTRVVLDSLLARGRGVIFLSAHLGNWELGAAAIAQSGYTFDAVVLKQPDPHLDELYSHYRRMRGINAIPLGRAARGCLAALRRNEIVAAIGDRDYTSSRETVEFFNHPARLPDGPAKLALATGAPILPIFMVRRHDDTYQFILGEPIEADKSKHTLPEVMQRIAHALEKVISEHSEQWYLFHDLWNVEEDRVLAKVAAFGEQESASADE